MLNLKLALPKFCRASLLLITLLWGLPSAVAQVPQIEQLKTTYKEVGSAKFSVLFWDIYQSRLASPTGKYHPEKTYLFEITYLRDIKAQDLIDRTIEQWQHIGLSESQYQAYLADIKNLWPDIAKGDKLSMYVADDITAFYHNDNFRGIVEHPSFAQDFVAIWLSEKTSQPKLRRQLLGESNAD
ncbi:chalcone isomerase family protein [Thalassotalea sp. LPB0316]|uniref:chalcone isomerase family protein n=1 Tax=Thalassotalea sp. LPB0316 TaxID=2769490 RepID=UPI001868254A|nr:chalcone isomerase family protein [Thalassotalea sp. LPB0316]QOL25550.1 chalcone isomerase family protein [Thalassotalea sp. LPB0316]